MRGDIIRDVGSRSVLFDRAPTSSVMSLARPQLASDVERPFERELLHGALSWDATPLPRFVEAR
jgi:hypothetical protein